jgi:predicted PurR-regulated permease PerM
MPLSRVVNCAVFAIWVSICAAAPEFIWRGFVILAGHLTLSVVYSVILIALLLAFFIEPLMERIKTASWELKHQSAKTSVYTAITALGFGIAAVSVHEAMNAYLGGEQVADHAKQANLLKAVEQVHEWASIPFVVTIIWFATRTRRRLSLPAGILVCLWVISIGFYYDWEWRDIIRTAAPSAAITVLGALSISASWDERGLARLASLTALVALCWCVVLGVAQGAAWSFGAPRIRIYAWDEFGEDFRFYLGWALGVAVAPSPLRGP